MLSNYLWPAGALQQLVPVAGQPHLPTLHFSAHDNMNTSHNVNA
uniref:Uncharacterized protein n=1 Tax=Arundo donax TaxID=35708 RepID=A0A0A9B457_ARUDO